MFVNLSLFPWSALFHVLFRNFAFNGRGLSGRPLHLQERQHLLRSLRHQVLQHLIVSKLTRFSPSQGGSCYYGFSFRIFQIRCRLLLHSAHKRPHGFLRKYTLPPSWDIVLQSSPISSKGQKTTIVQVEIIDKLYLAIPIRYKSKALINTILHFLTRLAPSPPTTNTWWSTLALR